MGQINAPSKQWWTATAARLRGFERLIREDLWLIAAVIPATLIGVQVGITGTALTPDGHLSGVWIAGPLIVVFVGIGVVLARMYGGRYEDQPDLP